MKKSFSSIALAALIAVVITGCGETPTPPPAPQVKKQETPDFRCRQEGALAPKWTCVPMVEDGYAGVGIAQKSRAGMGFMRRVALANGRSDLAQQIQTQVKDKVATFTRSTGVGSSEVVDQVNTAVSKQVAKVDLRGSKAIDAWTSPSGALYLLVTVPQGVVNKEVKKAVKSSFKNDEALWQQFQAKNALEELEKEFPE